MPISLCGSPTRFLGDVHDGLVQWGVEKRRIHAEMFGGGESSMPGVVGHVKRGPHAPDGGVAAGPEVGPLVSFTAGSSSMGSPRYRSILELAEACDVPVRWSCRTGVYRPVNAGSSRGAQATTPPAPAHPRREMRSSAARSPRGRRDRPGDATSGGRVDPRDLQDAAQHVIEISLVAARPEQRTGRRARPLRRLRGGARWP